MYTEEEAIAVAIRADPKEMLVEDSKLSPANDELQFSDKGSILAVDTGRAMMGVAARALFYPTLLYNVLRNRIQTDFRWWDWIDEFVLLGAVPFPSDVERLKQLGVRGVVTMNEPYETLVPTALYQARGIHNLVLPTRDYMFAPSLNDIFQAVDFIHENASHGQRTYVHCKAGRGRSTTIVLCYLVRYKLMTPNEAYNHVKAIRPRVLLASPQWKAVQEFYHHLITRTGSIYWTFSMTSSPGFIAPKNLLAFDDSSVLIITKADVDGYDPRLVPVGARRNKTWSGFPLLWPFRMAGVATLPGVSCLWLHFKLNSKKPG